jgi:hypothetical protein
MSEMSQEAREPSSHSPSVPAAPARIQHSDIVCVEPGSFDAQKHFYQRVLNAHIHPLVRYFFSLDNTRIAERYCHLHPEVEIEAVREVLRTEPRHFRWAGADLIHVTNREGVRNIVVIETNSSPSGQKSMPILHEGQEHAGYNKLIEEAFLPQLKRRAGPSGGIAVLYDKNLTEASGYAAAIADALSEPVYLVPFPDGGEPARARFNSDGLLEVGISPTDWVPIRGAFRYVTQRPWARIPPLTRTAMLNSVLVCLAGGRNKMLAAKAYDLYNGTVQPKGLHIRTPETIGDVSRDEIPLWVNRMGGVAVVKVPYSSAGRGVYTITSEEELEAFMVANHGYDRFIVQALIGNVEWSSRSASGKLYHVGTVPNRRAEIFVTDLRFMIGGGKNGLFPVAIYARRARSALLPQLDGTPSWDMLGTNLSVKLPNGEWDTQTERLLLMDSRDFNRLGIGLDELIESYIQTALAVTAIDRMAQSLVNSKGKFRRRFFQAINPDASLVEEICR